MKIYTKTGDTGETSLFDGNRVPKFHHRIEAYGTLDELNAYVGMVRSHLTETSWMAEIELLIKIQSDLFTIGSHLATEKEEVKSSLPSLKGLCTKSMEDAIDAYMSECPELRNFILPGGNTLISAIHIARTVCRRCERKCVALQQTSPLDPSLVPYINRLSDYFFALARVVHHRDAVAETPWNPSAK